MSDSTVYELYLNFVVVVVFKNKQNVCVVNVEAHICTDFTTDFLSRFLDITAVITEHDLR